MCRKNPKQPLYCPTTIEGNAILSGTDQNYFDVQFALNQFSGNQTLLVKILDKFNQQYLHFDTLLTEQLQQNDLHAAKQEVHSIKGVAGNLGMQALHNGCKNIELHMDGQISEQILDNYLQIFKQTLTLVQNYLAENSIEKSPEVAPKENNNSSLIKALKRNEFISESKLQNFMQSLDLSPEKLNELQQAIDDLDYASAIQLLE